MIGDAPQSAPDFETQLDKLTARLRAATSRAEGNIVYLRAQADNIARAQRAIAAYAGQ